MAVVYEKTKLLTDKPLHYCPGCTHGIIHRLVAEAIDELGVKGRFPVKLIHRTGGMLPTSIEIVDKTKKILEEVR